MEIGIRELRDGLSKHLAVVRSGRTVSDLIDDQRR